MESKPRFNETGDASDSTSVIRRGDVNHREIHAFVGPLEYLFIDGDLGDVVN